MNKDCHCHSAPGVTHVNIRGLTVGLVDIPQIFQQWLDGGKTPDSLGDQEIVQAVRERNHIATAVEADYAAALRSLFRAKMSNRSPEERRRSGGPGQPSA